MISNRVFAAGLGVLGTAAIAWADAATTSIYDMAPPTTILVAGVADAGESLGRLQETGLWRLWQSPEMKDLRREAREDFESRVGEVFQGLELEDGDFELPPALAPGMAMFVVVDPEQDFPRPGYLVLADYEGETKRAEGLVQRVRAAAEAQEGMHLEERDVRGRTVLSIERERDEEDPPRAPEIDEFGLAVDREMMRVGTVHLVRDGSVLLASSDLAALEHGLEVRDGEVDRPLSERDDLRGVLRMLGDHDAAAVVLTRDVGGIVPGVDPMGMAMMIGPMLKQMIGDVHGAGLSCQLATPTAMAEERISVYLPRGKVGLTALMDRAGPTGELPSFVGPNTLSYSEVNFDFRDLPTALLPLTRMMAMMAPPPEDGPTMAELIDQVAACLGEKAHVLQTLDRPIRSDSLRKVSAVECTRPREFENLLGALGAQAGLEGRDFAGHRIYTVDPMAMGGMPMPGLGGGGPSEPWAIGLGGGYVFVGPAAGIEQALRVAGDAGNAGLGDDPSFRRAIGALGSGPAVAWGYANVVESMEATRETSRLRFEALKAHLEADPDIVLDLPDEDPGVWGKHLDKLDADFLGRYLGPAAWKVLSTEDGFVMHAYLLEPAGEE